jgi:hypothetical protein
VQALFKNQDRGGGSAQGQSSAGIWSIFFAQALIDD